MRTLVTFILRLWVDPQAEEPTWEGQVECVSSNQRAHVRNVADLARFIEAEAIESKKTAPEFPKQEERTMNTRTRLIGLVAGCGLLLAVFVPLATHPAAAQQVNVDVRTVNISNEPPGYLIDHLYAQLGDVSFGDALGYLKDHSNGIISEEFYQAAITAPGSEEIFLTMLWDFLSTTGFTGSVEIGENGTIHTCSLRGNAAYTGFSTMLTG